MFVFIFFCDKVLVFGADYMKSEKESAKMKGLYNLTNSLDSYACVTRKEVVKKKKDCISWVEKYPLCAKNIKISYSSLPPYVFNSSGEIKGILPGKSHVLYLDLC